MTVLAAIALLLAAEPLALAVHELGHWTAARLLGYPTRLGWRSCRWGSDDRISPARHRRIVSAYGPAANLAAGLALTLAGLELLGAVQLLLAAFCLIPAGRLDGRRIVTGRA